MYGMLLESVQFFVQEQHGEDAWMAILEHAGLRNTVFTTHKFYCNELMVRLASACSIVLADGTPENYMHYFGQCFVKFCSHYGYDKILRVSGRHFRDFLHGIDNLHETMRFSYPKMLSPHFRVTHEDGNGLVLHYCSKRIGFEHYVMGQLKESAKRYYGVTVKVTLLEKKLLEEGCQVQFRLDFDNSAFLSSQQFKVRRKLQDYPPIPFSVFFKVFPFSIVYSKDMLITHMGGALQELFCDEDSLLGQDISEVFRLRRPLMDFTWKNITELQRVVCELESIAPIVQSCKYRPRTHSCSKNQHPGVIPGIKDHRSLLLKGQMKVSTDFNGIIFLCSPLISNLEELESLGLYVNELNMYDGSREMVLAGWQHASRLEYSIEKQVKRSKQIASNLKKLDIWKQRSENLLYSMIPETIAIRLKNGENPINTCEVFDSVTIMFGHLEGFQDIYHNISPTGLIQFVNQTISTFDTITDLYNVYKVETVGNEVYMVAGGVPIRMSSHTTSVAALALELIDASKHLTPPEGANAKMSLRIGMHSGSVVAGIVGVRMPQYCLFGDTVNTASRMQSYSEPGYIHLSEPCNKALEGSDYVTVFRGRLKVKGKGLMNTYWLAGHRSDPKILHKWKHLTPEQSRFIRLGSDGSVESFECFRPRRSRSRNSLSSLISNASDLSAPDELPEIIMETKETEAANTAASFYFSDEDSPKVTRKSKGQTNHQKQEVEEDKKKDLSTRGAADIPQIQVIPSRSAPTSPESEGPTVVSAKISNHGILAGPNLYNLKPVMPKAGVSTSSDVKAPCSAAGNSGNVVTSGAASGGSSQCPVSVSSPVRELSHDPSAVVPSGAEHKNVSHSTMPNFNRDARNSVASAHSHCNSVKEQMRYADALTSVTISGEDSSSDSLEAPSFRSTDLAAEVPCLCSLDCYKQTKGMGLQDTEDSYTKVVKYLQSTKQHSLQVPSVFNSLNFGFRIDDSTESLLDSGKVSPSGTELQDIDDSCHSSENVHYARPVCSLSPVSSSTLFLASSFKEKQQVKTPCSSVETTCKQSSSSDSDNATYGGGTRSQEFTSNGSSSRNSTDNQSKFVSGTTSSSHQQNEVLRLKPVENCYVCQLSQASVCTSPPIYASCTMVKVPNTQVCHGTCKASSTNHTSDDSSEVPVTAKKVQATVAKAERSHDSKCPNDISSAGGGDKHLKQKHQFLFGKQDDDDLSIKQVLRRCSAETTLSELKLDLDLLAAAGVSGTQACLTSKPDKFTAVCRARRGSVN